jgi:hypothetical protein
MDSKGNNEGILRVTLDYHVWMSSDVSSGFMIPILESILSKASLVSYEYDACRNRTIYTVRTMPHDAPELGILWIEIKEE